eukprot:scaffold129879_cov63-Phaeocystis_antarctica.AAC.2
MHTTHSLPSSQAPPTAAAMPGRVLDASASSSRAASASLRGIRERAERRHESPTTSLVKATLVACGHSAVASRQLCPWACRVSSVGSSRIDSARSIASSAGRPTRQVRRVTPMA